MIKRTLFFTTPCRLSIRNKQLIVEHLDNQDTTTIPIEDIGIVIVENLRISISLPTFNALCENNCAVVLCDERHMPASMLMPLESNSVQAETYKFQIDASSPIKKRLWQQVVEAKIKNQAAILNAIGQDGAILKPYYSNVKSGDSDNREGLAARIYWSALFGKDFVRDKDEEGINSLLNYGYAILRAGMARAIMGSGLYPAFGIFHKNRYNAFPLADDLMEPYRPFVDETVFNLIQEGDLTLDTEAKQALFRIMFRDTRIGVITRPLELSLSQTSSSFAKCLRGEAKRIVFPILE